MKNSFDIQPIHCQGLCDFTITNTGILYSVGQDDMIYSKNIKTSEEKREYLNADSGSFHAIAATGVRDKDCIIAGVGKTIELVENMNKEEISLLYMMSDKVEQIVYSKSGRCLGVATGDGVPAIYDVETKNIVKCRPGHIEVVLSVFFSHDEKFLCSTGVDGHLKVFSIEGDNYQTPALVFDYKICKDVNRANNPQQILRGMFNPSDTMIACPGKAFLQVIERNNGIFHETYKMGIRHEKEITICQWANNEVLITGGLDNHIRIWNLDREDEIIKIEQLSFHRMSTFENTFFGMNNSGSIYRFTKPELLGGKSQEVAQVAEIADIVSDSDEIEEIVPVKSTVKENEDNRRAAASKADKIITCLPQEAVTGVTEFSSNCRFLFYNTVGCVVQRKDGSSNQIEVEFHDTKIINKRKYPFKDREVLFFDLGVNRIAYANEREFGFMGECIWEHAVDEDQEIQGVVLGNDWIAVALDGSIIVYDLAGNHMNSISFDKSFVAMAAYEDLLALAYIDSVPIFGCQNIRMNIWNINGVSESIESVCVSLRPSSVLKAFGFSEEGLLYCQDSKEWIRVFNMQARKWVDVFNPRKAVDGPNFRYWIVGMSHFEVFAFKLAEGEFQPTVLPRVFPRKLKLSVPNPHESEAEGIYNNEKTNFGELLWRKLIIEHERFRYSTWYRYKFARNESNPNFSKSNSILSDEELNIKDTVLDSEMLHVVKNLALRNQAEKAFITAKTFLHSQKQLKKVMLLFTEAQLPEFAARIERHFEETDRLQQYDLAQKLRLKQLQQDMEQAINFKPMDPVNSKKESKHFRGGPSKLTLNQTGPNNLPNSTFGESLKEPGAQVRAPFRGGDFCTLNPDDKPKSRISISNYQPKKR